MKTLNVVQADSKNSSQKISTPTHLELVALGLLGLAKKSNYFKKQLLEQLYKYDLILTDISPAPEIHMDYKDIKWIPFIDPKIAIDKLNWLCREICNDSIEEKEKITQILSLTYKNPTPKIKKETKKFLESLEYMLPCQMCRSHIAKNLVEIPPNLNSRDEFILWTYKIHNKVNNLLNKEECNINRFCKDYSIKFNGISFEPFGNTTSEFHYPKKKKNSYFYLMILIGIIVIDTNLVVE